MSKKQVLPPSFKIPGDGGQADLSLAEVLSLLGQIDGDGVHDLKRRESEQWIIDDEEGWKKFPRDVKWQNEKRRIFIRRRRTHRLRRYLRKLNVPESLVLSITGPKQASRSMSPKYADILEDMALGLNVDDNRTAPCYKKLEEEVVKDTHAENIIKELQKKKRPERAINEAIEEVKAAPIKRKVILTGDEDYRNIHLERDPVKKLAMLTALSEDIVFFVKKVLGAEPTPQQIQLLTEFQKPGCRISVRSAHGTGKSCSLAWIILHSLLFVPDVRILCTAPSAPQMYDVLWSELKFWRSQMDSNWWESQIRITQKRAEFVAGTRNFGGDKQVDNANRFATARTARKDNPVALQGMHAKNMVVLVDEASGVPNEVYEVGEGTLTTKGAKVVMMSNPTTADPENYFFRSQNKHREFWTCLHFSAIDSPLVTDEWVEEEKQKYGEESPIYQFRVLGEFPKISDDILIPLHFVESAWGRDINASGDAICGVDPARFGADHTGVVIRQGGVIKHIEKWSKYDTMYTAARIADMHQQGMFDIACVDTIGLGGGVADRLRQLIGTQKVIDVNVQERAAAREEFNKLRDELWWKTREFFEKMSSSFDANLVEKAMFDEITGELCSIKYSYQANGKRKVQGKDDLRKDGRKSPNLADALCLTFVRDIAGESATIQHFPGIAREVVSAGSDGAVLG